MFKIPWIFMLLWVYGDFKVNQAIVSLQFNFLVHAFSHNVFFSIKNDQSVEARQR